MKGTSDLSKNRDPKAHLDLIKEAQLIPLRNFPNNDLKQEFHRWFEPQTRQRYIDIDLRVIRFGMWTITDSNLSQLLRSQSSSLNDLDFATLNINGHSTEVKAPPDIILADDDDDFIDDEDDVPHDIADSDDEVLTNVDDYDEAAIMSAAAEARDHIGAGVGDPPCPLHVRLASVVAAYKKQEWEVRDATKEAARMAEGR
nr:hypothetical protein [Tanacetum cinerariifolium]